MTFTPEELVTIKERLLEEKKKILHILEGTNKNIDFGDDTDHGEEEAEETEERVNEIGIEDSLKSSLQSIEKALKKIEEGKFGMCEQCGEPIEKEIFAVDPESHLCRVCKKGM